MIKKSKQQKANLRTCASCKWVYWGLGKSCPHCQFGASYGAIWCWGFGWAMLSWVTQWAHRRW